MQMPATPTAITTGWLTADPPDAVPGGATITQIAIEDTRILNHAVDCGASAVIP